MFVDYHRQTIYLSTLQQAKIIEEELDKEEEVEVLNQKSRSVSKERISNIVGTRNSE